MCIKFNYLVAGFRIRNSNVVRNWLKSIISAENFSCSSIDLFFVSDSVLKEINIEFLEHHYFTDVITFDYSVDRKLAAEIYISVDTIRHNARKYKQSVRMEILRVMAHGVLHLVGYDDKDNKMRLIMREKENEYLKLID